MRSGDERQGDRKTEGEGDSQTDRTGRDRHLRSTGTQALRPKRGSLL